MAPTRSSSKLPTSTSSSSIAKDDGAGGTGGTGSQKGSTGMRGVKRTNSDMQQPMLSFAPKKNLPPTPKKTPSRHTTRPATTSSSGPDQDDQPEDGPSSPISTGMMSPPLTQPSPSKKVRAGKGSVMLMSGEDDEEASVEENEEAALGSGRDRTKPSVLAGAWEPLAKLGKEPKSMLDNLNIPPYPESEDEGSVANTGEENVDEEDESGEDEAADEHILTPKYKVPAYTSSAQTGTKTRRAMLAAQEGLESVRSRSAATLTPAQATNKKVAKTKKADMKENAKDKVESAPEHLDPKDKKWEKVFWEAHGRMGADEVAPIHCTPKSHTRIHHILRVFDLSPEYGPAIGVSRLQRWQRAEEWGLDPPAEIRDILLTMEGAEDPAYRENVFYGTGIYATN